MNLTKRLLWPALLGLVLTSSAFAQAPAPVTTVRLTSGEWEPWTSASLPHFGIANRLLEDALASEGIKLQVEFFPWARALELAKDKAWDGSVAWIHTSARQEQFLYSDTVFEGKTVLFHRAAMPLDWQRYEDLVGMRIGTTLAYSYGDAFAQAVAQLPLTTEAAPSDEINIQKLLGGRVDIVPLDEFVGIALSRRLLGVDARKITYASRPINVSGNHVIVRKNHPQGQAIIEAINRGLAKVKARETPRHWLDRFYPVR